MEAKRKIENKRKIRELINSFSEIHFDKEITDFCRELLTELKDNVFLDILQGRPEIWAAAIIIVIARMNFLFDKTIPHSLKGIDTVCDFFGANKSTTTQKAAKIRDELEVGMGNPRYTRAEISDRLRIVQLPSGFAVTMAQYKEMIKLTGSLTEENCMEKLKVYYEIKEKKSLEERKTIELENQKRLEEARITAQEEKRKKQQEKWENEKEFQPDLFNF